MMKLSRFSPAASLALFLIGAEGFIPAFLVLVLIIGSSTFSRGLLVLGNFGTKTDPEGPPDDNLLVAKTADRIVFTLGVLNIGITSYIVGAFPTKFYIWHTLKVLLLLSLRFKYFHQRKMHYKLFELCYVVNFLSLVYIWIFPKSEVLFQVLFGLANGPLAWSVLAFKNSLIFHNREQMTSAFIHMSPMIWTYGLRWNPSLEHSVDSGEFQSDLTRFLRPVLTLYLPWIIGYYFIVFVILGPRAKQKGNKTLFDQLVAEGKATIFMKMTPYELVNKGLYLLGHFSMGSFVVGLTPFLWKSFYGHTFCHRKFPYLFTLSLKLLKV